MSGSADRRPAAAEPGCWRLHRWMAARLLAALAGSAGLLLSAAAGGQDQAKLVVTVQLSAGGAVQQSRPLATEVRVVPVGDDGTYPVASERTGPDGTASLAVPGGHYWVFVPAATGDELRTVAQTSLPNGVAVSGWAEVDLAPGDRRAVTITLANLAPAQLPER